MEIALGLFVGALKIRDSPFKLLLGRPVRKGVLREVSREPYPRGHHYIRIRPRTLKPFSCPVPKVVEGHGFSFAFFSSALIRSRNAAASSNSSVSISRWILCLNSCSSDIFFFPSVSSTSFGDFPICLVEPCMRFKSGSRFFLNSIRSEERRVGKECR